MESVNTDSNLLVKHNTGFYFLKHYLQRQRNPSQSQLLKMKKDNAMILSEMMQELYLSEHPYFPYYIFLEWKCDRCKKSKEIWLRTKGGDQNQLFVESNTIYGVAYSAFEYYKSYKRDKNKRDVSVFVYLQNYTNKMPVLIVSKDNSEQLSRVFQKNYAYESSPLLTHLVDKYRSTYNFVFKIEYETPLAPIDDNHSFIMYKGFQTKTEINEFIKSVVDDENVYSEYNSSEGLIEDLQSILQRHVPQSKQQKQQRPVIIRPYTIEDKETFLYTNCSLFARVYKFNGIKPLLKGSNVGMPILQIEDPEISFVKKRRNYKKKHRW